MHAALAYYGQLGVAFNAHACPLIRFCLTSHFSIIENFCSAQSVI